MVRVALQNQRVSTGWPWIHGQSSVTKSTGIKRLTWEPWPEHRYIINVYLQADIGNRGQSTVTISTCIYGWPGDSWPEYRFKISMYLQADPGNHGQSTVTKSTRIYWLTWETMVNVQLQNHVHLQTDLGNHHKENKYCVCTEKPPTPVALSSRQRMHKCQA